MRVIFLAEKPCALTVNGLYLGRVDGFERSVEADPRDGVFCELSPVGYLPVRFRLDEAFLFEPPPHVELYFSGREVAIYCRDFLRDDPSLSVLRQERIADSRLTLCMQGRLQLHLENETGFHIVSLPEAFQSCRPFACGDNILLETGQRFALLSRTGEILLNADGRVLERGPTWKAEIFFRDSAGHSAVCEWEGGKLVSCAVRAAREPDEATYALALFESVLIGADCEPYLGDALKPKKDALKSFLGDFRAVVLTERPDVVGLVYARKERVYDVRAFRIELSDGKIVNIKEED